MHVVGLVVISKLLNRHSKAKRRAPAYSQALRKIRGVFQRTVRGRLRSGYKVINRAYNVGLISEFNTCFVLLRHSSEGRPLYSHFKGSKVFRSLANEHSRRKVASIRILLRV